MIVLLFCDVGTIQVTINNVQYLMQSGDMILVGSNVVHKTFKARTASRSLYNILFDKSVVQNVISSSENRCVNSFLNYFSIFINRYIEHDAAPHGIAELIQKMVCSYYADGVFNYISLRALRGFSPNEFL